MNVLQVLGEEEECREGRGPDGEPDGVGTRLVPVGKDRQRHQRRRVGLLDGEEILNRSFVLVGGGPAKGHIVEATAIGT